MISIPPETPIRLRPIFQVLHRHAKYRSISQGVKYFPKYQFWLKSKIIDLGCGAGNVVNLCNQKGFEAEGIDFIQHDLMQVGDISKLADYGKYTTAICLDVIQYLSDTQIDHLFQNMRQTKKQVFLINTGSIHLIFGKRLIELNVNRKTRKAWCETIEDTFKIEQIQTLGRSPGIGPNDMHYHLFFTSSK